MIINTEKNTNFLGASWLMLSSSASSLGEIVSRSQPARASTLKRNESGFLLTAMARATHLSSVSEAGAHDNSLIVVLLVVVVDLAHAQHSGILLCLIGL